MTSDALERDRARTPGAKPVRARIWESLENHDSLSTVEAAWRADLGEDFDFVRALFLERSPHLAETYPCPVGCGCAHQIIWEPEGRPVAVCRCEDWNCDDLKLAPADLVCWRVSWSKLGRALCRCFGLDLRPGEFGLANTRQIGAWPSGAVPILLTLQPDPRIFRQTLLELGSRLPEGFILLAPTSRNVSAPELELLARHRAGFFDLESSTRLASNGSLSCPVPPGELFRRLTPQPKPEDRSVLERAFALVKTLEQRDGLARPGVLAVFSEFCVEGHNISQIARKFDCSRGTILNRLRAIRRATGSDPLALRQVSSHMSALQSASEDSRARRLYRRGLLDQPQLESED